VTLSLLELAQLADMFRFIVVCWVKDVNWIVNITVIKIKSIERVQQAALIIAQF
jgi:hypothetical protein